MSWKINCLLAAISPCVSGMSAYFVSIGSEWLCFGLFFQWCLYSKQSWKIQTVSPSGTKGRHAYCPWRRLGSYSTPLCAQGAPALSLRCPLERGSRNWHRKMQILWQLLLLWAAKRFNSDPGVLCLLSGSINDGRLRVKEEWILKGKLRYNYLKKKEWMLGK